MPNKFELGILVITPGCLEAFRDTKQEPGEFISRHMQGDWGEVDEHDRRENEFSLQNDLRIMSVYTLKTGVKVWIISEADRSSTCVLLPEDY